MKANEFITEVFDSPLKYTWDSPPNTSGGDAHFYAGPVLYQVMIEKINMNEVMERGMKGLSTIYQSFGDEPIVYDISFMADWETGVTNTGNAIQVFSTVNSIVRNFINAGFKMHAIQFGANKSEAVGDSRAKLYDRFAKIFQDAGWKVHTVQLGDEKYYVLVKP
jgi:hypothetical protein